MWRFCKRFFLTLSACFVVMLAIAQPKNNSPYSRFGLGDILNQNFAAQRATPGFTNAYRDPFHLNYQNPASLGYLQMATFEVGIFGQNSKWESSSQSNKNWSGNLGYMALGFTLKNPINEILDREARDFAWGMTFGLVPYTLVGYSVETSGEIPNIGLTTSRFVGEGGTYQFIWGNGVRYKNFAVGLNLGYLFGKIENRRTVTFEDIDAGYEDRFLDDFSINGLTWKFGLLYDFVIDKSSVQKSKVLTIGVTANANQSLNTNAAQFYERFNRAYVTPQDTITNTSDLRGKATLPLQLGLGLIYSAGSKWKFGLGYDFAAWSKYKNDAKPENLKDTWQISFGGEFIPDYASYNSFLKRVSYRFGSFVGKDPRSIDSKQIGTYGITLGFGLPLTLPQRKVSFIDLSIELGKRGANTVLQETYAQFTVGFTLNDNLWFIKRKFN